MHVSINFMRLRIRCLCCIIPRQTSFWREAKMKSCRVQISRSCLQHPIRRRLTAVLWISRPLITMDGAWPKENLSNHGLSLDVTMGPCFPEAFLFWFVTEISRQSPRWPELSHLPRCLHVSRVCHLTSLSSPSVKCCKWSPFNGCQ